MNFSFDHDVCESASAQRLPPTNFVGAKGLYLLLREAPEGHTRRAQAYLDRQLASVAQWSAQASSLDPAAELPINVLDVEDMIDANIERVGARFDDYLQMRHQGGPRRFFATRSHALFFLKSVAPTKLVDGAWLYGLLPQWHNPQFHGLIRTYLEELGDGIAANNHVVIYQKLLAAHSCDDWDQLGDDYFVQGALQLCLARNAQDFLPEIIGYNLGYEQLPLHLLITSYELNELGIDPYYFNLHITIDNAASGHAHKAAQALRQLMPVLGDADEFYRRVRNGYRLNQLGLDTQTLIDDFDLEDEVINILVAKSRVGKNMHSDYCRVAGRSVNDWLSDPAQIPDFLNSLQGAGWIKRGEPVENSRFWHLIDGGERSDMFGVFSSYEQQVLRDWIAGVADAPAAKVPTHRMRLRALDKLMTVRDRGVDAAIQNLIQERSPTPRARGDSELRVLEERVASLSGREEAMRVLQGFMSPVLHFTPVGLMATRMFARLLDA